MPDSNEDDQPIRGNGKNKAQNENKDEDKDEDKEYQGTARGTRTGEAAGDCRGGQDESATATQQGSWGGGVD